MDMYSKVLDGVFVFLMGKGIKGNSARLQKVSLAKMELSSRIFCPAADFTFVLCASRDVFYCHLMEEKCCFNNADYLLAVLSQLFPRVGHVV